MAGATKAPEPKPDPKPAPQRALAPAASATDPEVHSLLVKRSALEQQDAQQRALITAAQKDIDGRRGRHVVITKRLAELGYR